MNNYECDKCPVNECDAKYRGSRCATLRAQAGADFDPMTNGDRLRSSDKQLAAALTSAASDGCPPKMNWDCAKDEYGWDACEACWGKWLREPASEN